MRHFISSHSGALGGGGGGVWSLSIIFISWGAGGVEHFFKVWAVDPPPCSVLWGAASSLRLPQAQGATSSPGWPGLTLHSRATVPSLSSLPLPLWGFHLFPLSLDPILLHGCHIAARSHQRSQGHTHSGGSEGRLDLLAPPGSGAAYMAWMLATAPTSAPSSVPGGPHTFLRVCVSRPPRFMKASSTLGAAPSAVLLT